jgi:hypothetical protein
MAGQLYKLKDIVGITACMPQDIVLNGTKIKLTTYTF